MSYYRMHRGWMDHPIFRNAKHSPREAWCWLIENANYADGRIFHNGTFHPVLRGQIVISYRKLGDRWGWSADRVIRFLNTLNSDGMIALTTINSSAPVCDENVSDSCVGAVAKTRHGPTVITICNYDEYQACDDDSATPARHECDTSATPASTIIRKKEGKKKKEEDYAFTGKVIRLTKNDLETWRKTFHAIPDIEAELRSLDGWYAEHGGEKWFYRAGQSLKDAHQRRVEEENLRKSGRFVWG